MDIYTGDADYSFNLIEGDTVLNGPFRLKRANLDALLQKQDYSFDFSGSFKNNYPEGAWKFQFGKFESNNESQVVDYQYRVAISGVQEEASGIISQGKPDGSWVYRVNRIEDSQVTETLFKSSINFKQGIPQQNFRIENDFQTLAGRFLRNGLAHDEWSLYESSGIGAAETWSFKDGLLDNIQIETNGISERTGVYGNFNGQTKIINLDAQYINALSVYQFSNSDVVSTIGGRMQNLLAQNATYYEKIDNILSELGESSFLPEFKVKVPYFPFSDVEKEQLLAIKNNYETAKSISTTFLKDTQLNILKLSDEEAAFQYMVIHKITDDFLNPIEKFITYDQQGVSEFAPRNKLIQNLWLNGKPATAINVIVATDSINKQRSFTLPTSKEFDFSGNDIETVLQLTEYALRSLNSIKIELQKKLINEQRQQDLVALEEQLIVKQNSLHAFVDSVATYSPLNNRRVLYKLKEHSDAALSSYSSLTNLNEKLTSAKSLNVCYNELSTLATSITDLPEQENAISEKYLDRVWNPFMATLMDEEVKKRIIAAYRKVLVPYFLEQASSEFKCTEVGALNSLMKDTYQRMLELRVENTAKLERKLRKVSEPEKVLVLFELEQIAKEQ